MTDKPKDADALTGKCNLCRRSYSRRGMTRHIASCLKKRGSGVAIGQKGAKKAKAFHLVVEDRYLLDYWLHLLAPATALLADLDSFLRGIWLECCGHLSEFQIGQSYYKSLPPETFFEDESEEDWGEFDDDEDVSEGFDPEAALASFKEVAKALGFGPMAETMFGASMPEDRDMNVALGEVLRPKLYFGYTYDFGTSSLLRLKVASEVEAVVADDTVQLLARNDAPDLRCQSCGKPAVEICTQCMYDENAWFCKRCARKHGCDEETFLPIVNSPRMGMCGYFGPETKEYRHVYR